MCRMTRRQTSKLGKGKVVWEQFWKYCSCRSPIIKESIYQASTFGDQIVDCNKGRMGIQRDDEPRLKISK